MDFSYFTSAPQPYQFFGLPPTPATSQTPQLEDYRAPPADQYDAAFAAFQQSFHYDPTTFLAQPHQLSTQSPTRPTRQDSVLSIPDIDLSGLPPQPSDQQGDEIPPGRSSSEEKDTLTPQQNRRKEQNRAAQRAFRERKEKHVKDLEARLTSLQHQSVVLSSENERLRRELAKKDTENEILRATSGSQLNGPTPFMTDPDELVGPLGYIPTDRPPKTFLSKPDSLDPDSKYDHFRALRMVAIDDDSGEPLLGAGDTWDYLQEHDLYRKGLVDVGDVVERLKKVAKCDGQGPVFQQSDVQQAIIDSAVAGGRDELI